MPVVRPSKEKATLKSWLFSGNDIKTSSLNLNYILLGAHVETGPFIFAHFFKKIEFIS